jgi:hypothetical protein
MVVVVALGCYLTRAKTVVIPPINNRNNDNADIAMVPLQQQAARHAQAQTAERPRNTGRYVGVKPGTAPVPPPTLTVVPPIDEWSIARLHALASAAAGNGSPEEELDSGTDTLSTLNGLFCITTNSINSELQ